LRGSKVFLYDKTMGDTHHHTFAKTCASVVDSLISILVDLGLILNTAKLKQNTLSKPKPSQAPVVHLCNPSYSGGRDQEDHDSKPDWANSSPDPILKILNTKTGLGEWLRW
jgi:hypothetical protein